MKNETHARIKINKLLEEAGWRFFDNEQGKANILLENHVKITRKEEEQALSIAAEPQVEYKTN